MKIGKLSLSKSSGWRNLSAVFLFCAAAAIGSSAQTFTTLFDFTGTPHQAPSALIQGFDGNFYGTTANGGTNNSGSAFKFTPSGTLTTLYSFCSQVNQGNCVDGKAPTAGVVQATNGTFYGTTSGGGMNGLGSIFTVTANGKFTSLYSFCALLFCTDGFGPTGLVQATNGNFYGPTISGGAFYFGTVFEITPTGNLTTLYAFHARPGSQPIATLLQATNGNLYGTTENGNLKAAPGGTVFQITPTGTLTTLHNFDSSSGGGVPNGLVQGPDGSLYGTTQSGGTSHDVRCGGAPCGIVFRITPTGKFTTIYNFCSQPNCADGGSPQGSLVLGTDGNFYGTTNLGGNSNSVGTIFKITPQGVLTTLYTFCAQTNCADGASPQTALLQATDGNFYGTTYSGGLMR